MTTANKLRQRLERIEAQRDEARYNVYDMMTWTDEQLEAVARTCTIDMTRLTNDELRAIIGTPE